MLCNLSSAPECSLWERYGGKVVNSLKCECPFDATSCSDSNAITCTNQNSTAVPVDSYPIIFHNYEYGVCKPGDASGETVICASKIDFCTSAPTSMPTQTPSSSPTKCVQTCGGDTDGVCCDPRKPNCALKNNGSYMCSH